MRIVISVAIVFLLLTPALVQAQNHENKEEKTKEEIQRIFSDLNVAIAKKDRPRLEQLYADEFQLIHSSGAVVDKVKQIDGIMANDPLAANPVPAPAIDNLMVYGDMVVSRNTVRGTAISSIFVKKDGRWQLLQAQGTLLAPKRNPVNLDPKLLDSFLGRYQFAQNAIATVTREGDALRWQVGTRMLMTLVPLSETHFYAKETEMEMMFVKNASGQVTDVTMRLGSCQEFKATKID